jgi:hypothetical protein
MEIPRARFSSLLSYAEIFGEDYYTTQFPLDCRIMAAFRKPKVSNMDHVVDLPTTAAPDGFRWALLPEESSSVDRRRGEILKFDDPKSQKIKEFKYQPLSNMKKRIRLSN